jgi:hypothetical protein
MRTSEGVLGDRPGVRVGNAIGVVDGFVRGRFECV